MSNSHKRDIPTEKCELLAKVALATFPRNCRSSFKICSPLFTSRYWI